MEIDISEFFNSECPSDYSASRAEIGQNAAMDTWNAAKENAEDYTYLLDTEEKREAFIEHMTGMGFSEGEEMQSWTVDQLTALFLQLISGDMREFLGAFGENASSWDWEEYEKQSNDGQVAGRMFKGDDEKIYYYLGT